MNARIALHAVLLIAGLATIIGAATGWPGPAAEHQDSLQIGGGLMVVFAVFGVRRCLGETVGYIIGEILAGLLSLIVRVIF